ncbi:MAG: hypothetical protein GX845_03780 [Erysipelothrix sp.]|nr:hypothetical protein [Erysipelothrix sp.]
MFNRIQYLEKLQYKSTIPFFVDDLETSLKTLFEPHVVDDISNMDNGYAFEFLIAINNQGFFAHKVDLGDGVTMHDIDDAIVERDLYFLNITVSTEKPFASAVYLKYPKGSDNNTPELSTQPFHLDHQRFFDLYLLFLNEYHLVHVTLDDLKQKVKWEAEIVSFYYRYFNPYLDDALKLPF